jgi:hypothetical protein
MFDDGRLGRQALVQDIASFHRLLELLRPRAKRLTDFVEQARPLWSVDAVEYEPDAVAKHLSSPELAGTSRRCGRPGADDAVRRSAGEAAVRNTATARGIKAGALIHATRVAVTGADHESRSLRSAGRGSVRTALASG